MTITEFLLERIAEDEVTARRAAQHRVLGPPNDSSRIASGTTGEKWSASYDQLFSSEFGEDGRKAKFAWVGSMGSDLTRHIARHDPARVLAECETKRRIVEKAQHADQAFAQHINPASSAASFALTEVLHYLALPYADHPDYQPEWKL